MAGVDPSKISPANPFEKNGMTASMLQAAVSEIDPAQAAKWRVAAGGSLSVATLAELNSGGDLSPAAKKDLWEHDHEFVKDAIQHREQSDAAVLKALEEQTEQLRFNREVRAAGGNEHVARRRIDAENAANHQHQLQKEEMAQRDRELNLRIAQQRSNTDRMSGRFIQP